MIIGSHVSFDKDKQLLKSVEEATSYGATTFMFYTGAPQNTNRSAIDSEKTEEAFQRMKELGIEPENVIVHAPYIINLANNIDPAKYNFSISFLKEELKRCEKLKMKYLVLHPGSHVGLGKEQGIKNIQNALNLVLEDSPSNVMILLETMAGKGTEVGTSIDEIQEIISGVTKKDSIGVCLDTCHLNDAGYDLTKFEELLEEIHQKIGLEKVRCIHINDSKNERAAHKDRHENIGLGTIGFDTLLKIIYNKQLENVPKILETPYIDHAYPPYKFEIKMILDKKQNEHLIEDIKNYYQTNS